MKMKSERLNNHCFCVSLDSNALSQAFAAQLESSEMLGLLRERFPYLFSARPVFLSESQMRQMGEAVQAVERVVALPAYQSAVVAPAADVVQQVQSGPRGVFFGYDFHVSDEGIGLIEVNTNAGGAMLNAVMARAHHSCCLSDRQLAEATASAMALEEDIVDMFQAEWRLSEHSGKLETIAIVDAEPQQQYLYPEFLLFQQLLKRHDIQAVIAAPEELHIRNGKLTYDGKDIDLVYNRLTDFMLEFPASAALKAAYLENLAVVTPNPRHHALYANKRNMALLGDDDWLRSIGVPQEVRQTLSEHVLSTELVSESNAERLWAARKQLFFKPSAGFGSRAAYRGDKVTKRVWQEIVSGGYVAQALMPPGERMSGSRQDPSSLKFDIRCYVYASRIQWTTARLYQGQTTNFRTEGGGFAPVYSLPDREIRQQTETADGKQAVDTGACCTRTCD